MVDENAIELLQTCDSADRCLLYSIAFQSYNSINLQKTNHIRAKIIDNVYHISKGYNLYTSNQHGDRFTSPEEYKMHV